MPVLIKNEKYYRFSEVCKIVGISRSTICRWIKAGVLEDSSKRDRRGWRLFSEVDLKIIGDEAYRIK